MALTLGVGVALCAALGCKSRSPTHYDSPRVTGRVLDARTHQPVANVRIEWVRPYDGAGSMEQIKGGQILTRLQPIRSHADGSFELAAQKSLSLWSQFAWFSVKISFAYSGYDQFTTNYTPADAIILPSGESVIHTGDVLLEPKANLSP